MDEVRLFAGMVREVPNGFAAHGPMAFTKRPFTPIYAIPPNPAGSPHGAPSPNLQQGTGKANVGATN